MASGTRTAPAITSTPVARRVSWSVIGINDNKVVTKSFLCSALSTDLEIEEYINDIQALSTASIFKVEISDVYEGTATKANATGDGRPSVDDHLVMTMKNVAQKNTRRIYVPAPVSDIFDANSENIQTTDPLIVALIASADAIGAGYVASWVSFAEHSETNEKQAL